MKLRLFLALVGTVCAIAAQAHEFWIEPEDYTLDPGDAIVAAIRVGQNFSGSSYAYIPQNFRRFEIALGDEMSPVEMRMGDRPALDMAVTGDGLGVILHVTTDSNLRYKDAETFERFVTHKDAAWALARHAERGLPAAGFTERYSRYAKSLVALGDGAGADRAFGLLTEIVALANPYTDDLSAGMPVQVLFEGAPRPGAQVEIFEKAGKAVTVATVAADADGRALVPVTPGRSYMLDSVVLRELDGKGDRGAVWESLWANLTFEVPE